MKISEWEKIFKEHREAHGDIEVQARDRAGEFQKTIGCAVVDEFGWIGKVKVLQIDVK